MELMRTLKIFSVLVWSIVIAIVFCTPVMAEGQNEDELEQITFYEADYMDNDEFEISEFNLLCYTSMDFYGKTLRLYFQDVNTYKIFCIESESAEYKKGDFKAQLPLGTYRLYKTTLDNDIYFNYQYAVEPEEFTVSREGIEGSEDNMLVFAANKKKVVAEKNNTTFCVISDIDDVEVQIGLSGILDASYTNGAIPQRNIYLVNIKEDGIYTREIAEGKYEVQSVQVYDEEKNPLHVYYKQEAVFGSGENENCFLLYVFSDEAALQKDKEEELKQEGYILKKADKMSEYKNSYNKCIVVPKDELDEADDTTFVDIQSYLEKLQYEKNYIEETDFSQEEKEEMKEGDAGLEGDEISKEEKTFKEFVSESKNLQDTVVTRKRFPFVIAGAVIAALIFRFVIQKKNK